MAWTAVPVTGTVLIFAKDMMDVPAHLTLTVSKINVLSNFTSFLHILEEELNKTLQAKEILRLPMDLEDFEFLDISDVLAKIITVFVNDSLVNQTTTLPEIIPDNVRPILNYTFFYVSNEQVNI